MGFQSKSRRDNVNPKGENLNIMEQDRECSGSDQQVMASEEVSVADLVDVLGAG